MTAAESLGRTSDVLPGGKHASSRRPSWFARRSAGCVLLIACRPQADYAVLAAMLALVAWAGMA